MKKHKINTKDLADFVNEEKVLFASSSGEEGVKRLYRTLNGNYEVWSNGKLIIETDQSYEAVKAYNKI